MDCRNIKLTMIKIAKHSTSILKMAAGTKGVSANVQDSCTQAYRTSRINGLVLTRFAIDGPAAAE